MQNIEFRFYEIYRSEEFLLLLLKGMFVSLWLTIGAAIFGFVFANLLAVSRLNKIPIFDMILIILMKYNEYNIGYYLLKFSSNFNIQNR